MFKELYITLITQKLNILKIFIELNAIPLVSGGANNITEKNQTQTF